MSAQRVAAEKVARDKVSYIVGYNPEGVDLQISPEGLVRLVGMFGIIHQDATVKVWHVPYEEEKQFLPGRGRDLSFRNYALLHYDIPSPFSDPARTSVGNLHSELGKQGVESRVWELGDAVELVFEE